MKKIFTLTYQQLKSVLIAAKISDPDLYHELKSIRPDWFKRTHKETLLEMAKEGKPKPTRKTNLRNSLLIYMNPNYGYYDPEFTEEIKSIRPEWLKKKMTHKETLLEMAKEGKPRPTRKTQERLYEHLNKFMNQNNEEYDPEFAKELKRIRPDWFKKKKTNKEILLKMAKDGKPKPKRGTQDSLCTVLMAFMNPNYEFYDPEFTNKIKQLRPEWLKKRAS